MNGKKAILIAGLSILITILILIYRFRSETPRRTTVKQDAAAESQLKLYPEVSPYPDGSSCSTGKATGAKGTRMFYVSHLAGDGNTDDYDSIQNTINDAGNAGGGIVSLPSGTFIINGHLTMRDNVTLEGTGPTTTIRAGPEFLNNDSETGYSIISTNGASNVTIMNLTADQQGNRLDGNSVNRFRGYIIHVHNSTNVILDGVYTRNPFAYAIVAENSTVFCFKNNNTQVNTNGKYDQLDGIHVLNSTFGDVLNNYVDQGHGADGDDGLVAHTIDGSVHDVTYAGNKVRGGRGGSGMQLALTNPTDTIYNIKIQNNEFWGSPRGIRTGYYGGPDGSVHDVVIGGSPATGNYIHDNIFNNINNGDSVNIYGNGIDPYNITATYNKSCKAGTFSVGKGQNNSVRNNTECKGS